MDSSGELPRTRPALDRDRLEAILRRRLGELAAHPDPALAGRTATVVLDAGSIGSWCLRLHRGKIWLNGGRPRHPTTTITTRPEALLDIVEGRGSGAEFFLSGALTVRGDLSLALALDGTAFRSGVPGHRLRARSVVAAGFRTFYLEAGPPDGVPVLLLHGLGATNASMLPTLLDLADRYRVLAPDLPGHGGTQARRGRYDPAMFARWAGAFLDATGTDAAVVVGNSLGGRIALEVGFELPERVRALVLFAPAAAFRRLRQFAPLVRAARHELAAVPLPVTHRMAVLGLKALFAVPERLADSWYDAAADEFQRVFSDRTHRIAFFAALRQIYLDDAFGDRGFWTRLERMHIPSLFVWGERDRLVPAGFARHVARALPDATSVVLPNCGHVPQFELPERTHELVRRFLTGLPGGLGSQASETAS